MIISDSTHRNKPCYIMSCGVHRITLIRALNNQYIREQVKQFSSCYVKDILNSLNMNQTIENSQHIRLKAYSVKDLSMLYECSRKTMRKWIGEFAKEVGPRVGHFYTPKQTKIIFEKVGIPGIISLQQAYHKSISEKIVR